MRAPKRLRRADRSRKPHQLPVVRDIWADKRIAVESLPEDLRPEPGRFGRGSVWDDIHLPGPADHHATWAGLAAALPPDDRGERRFIAVLKAEPASPGQDSVVNVWVGRLLVGSLGPEDAARVREDLLEVEGSGAALWCVGMLSPGSEDGQWGLRLGFTRPLPTEREQGMRV